MSTVVKLQDPFSYSLTILLCLVALVLLPLVIYWAIKLIMILSGKPKIKKTKKPKKVKKVKDLDKLKTKCLSKIDDIENDYRNNKIDSRESFIRLSYVVREFVQSATGVNTSNMALSEIKELSMPSLSNLIEMFYKPEFSQEETNDENQFNDARKVVKEWN